MLTVEKSNCTPAGQDSLCQHCLQRLNHEPPLSLFPGPQNHGGGRFSQSAHTELRTTCASDDNSIKTSLFKGDGNADKVLSRMQT